MSQKGLDFKHKEVINIKDGKRLGFVQDVCANLENGSITSIIVPGNNKIMNIFSNANDIVIPWQNIKCIRRRCYISRNIKNRHKKTKKVLTIILHYVIINKYSRKIENIV